MQKKQMLDHGEMKEYIGTTLDCDWGGAETVAGSLEWEDWEHTGALRAHTGVHFLLGELPFSH